MIRSRSRLSNEKRKGFYLCGSFQNGEVFGKCKVFKVLFRYFNYFIRFHDYNELFVRKIDK